MGQFPLPPVRREGRWVPGVEISLVTLTLQRCEGSFSQGNGPFGPQAHSWPCKDEGIRILLLSPQGAWGCRWGVELQVNQQPRWKDSS